MEQQISEKFTAICTGGVALILDRFIDLSADERPPEQKLYLDEKNGLIFPSENLYSFLFGETFGCASRFEGKKWREYKLEGMSSVVITPEFIPLTRNGKQVIFTKFVNEWDEKAKIRVLHHKAIVKKGKLSIPSPKVRPAVFSPWELKFQIEVFRNHLIDAQKIKNWLIRGGLKIGLGTYRPRFGRFTVEFTDVA